MNDEDGLAIAMLVLRAATQVVDGIQRGLAARGFTDVRPAHGFTRETDPRDGRSRLLCLTARGWACTHAAEQAAAETAGAWERQLGADTMASLHAALPAVVLPGRLRRPSDHHDIPTVA
ncbi:MAG: hypothetical protein ACRDSR_01830 [Pseudonocardiaceae bacterium]